MGALDDALNGLDNNESALAELATIRSKLDSSTSQITDLTESLDSLKETESDLRKQLDESAGKDDTIARLRGELTEMGESKSQLESITKERDELKGSYDSLLEKNTTALRGRLESYGIKQENMKDHPLETLEAMESAILQVAPPGKSRSGQGLGNGGGTTESERLSGLDRAKKEMEEIVAKSTSGGQRLRG